MRAATIVFLGCLGIATAAHAMPGDTLFTQDGAVNVYSDPSPNAPLVMQLDRGRKLVEIKREGSWVKVGVFRLGASGLPTGFIGDTGWVRRTLVWQISPGGDEGTGPPKPSQEPVDRSIEKTLPIVGTEFELYFSGDYAREFRASCQFITGTGRLTRRRFGGVTPKGYRFVARAVSCTAPAYNRLAVTLQAKAGDIVEVRRALKTTEAGTARRIHVWTVNFKKLYRQARRNARY